MCLHNINTFEIILSKKITLRRTLGGLFGSKEDIGGQIGPKEDVLLGGGHLAYMPILLAVLPILPAVSPKLPAYTPTLLADPLN